MQVVKRKAGRPKGSVSKRRQVAHDILTQLEAELGRKVNPLEGLLRIAADKSQPIAIQVQCFAEALPYLYPKLQSQALAVSRGEDPPTDETADFMAVMLTSPDLVDAAQRMSLAMSGEPDASSADPQEPATTAPAGDTVLTLEKDSRGHWK